MALRDHKVFKVFKEDKVLKGTVVPRAIKEILVHKDHRVFRVP